MSFNDDWTDSRDELTDIHPHGSNVIQVPTKEIARRIKSFDHFVYIWGHKANFYLPPRHALTWHFISQVLAGHKKLLKNEIVGQCIEMPKVRGYRIKEIHSTFVKECPINEYLPDFGDTDCIPRNYFFNVIKLGFASHI